MFSKPKCIISKKALLQSGKIYKQFDDLLDSYNNTNSFLYSSLNMEIVCSILKGINVIVRELHVGNKT